MDDYLVRIITEEKNILGLACITTNLVNDARKRHGTFPTATAALGRALTGGELLGALLEPDQRVALKFTGNGPLKKIIVEAEGDGTVRGYVEVPQVDLPPRNGKFDVGGALGREGFLTVTKDLRLKEPYNGVVKLYTGEIASDIAFYLTESEQIPSAVGLGVFVETDGSVTASGGFLVQSLPPADEALIDSLAGRIENMPPITRQLKDGKDTGRPPGSRVRWSPLSYDRDQTAVFPLLVFQCPDRAGAHNARQVPNRRDHQGPGGIRHLLPLLQPFLCLPERPSPAAAQ